jgi:hypothetical protein
LKGCAFFGEKRADLQPLCLNSLSFSSGASLQLLSRKDFRKGRV